MTDAFSTAASLPLIICDIDDTLAFYTEASAIAVNARFGKGYTLDQFTTWHGPFTAQEREWQSQECHGNPAFVRNLAPDHSAIHGLKQLARLGFPITISSDRPKKVRAAGLQWLEYWGVPFDNVVLSGPGGKEKVAASHGPDNPVVLFDDSPAKWLTFPGPGRSVMCPRRPYTPTGMYAGVTVFDSWDQAIRILEGAPVGVS